MSRIVGFDSKIIAGKLVKVPKYESLSGAHTFPRAHQRSNDFNTAAGRPSLGLYGASQAFPGTHNSYAKYDEYGKTLNFRAVSREEMLSSQTSKMDLIRSQRAEAESNRIRALNQIYKSVLSPEPEQKFTATRPISSDPLAVDVASALVSLTRAKILRINGKLQHLDPHGTGLLYSEDVRNILNIHDVDLSEKNVTELLTRYQSTGGKIYYKDLWQYLSECHLKRESLLKKRQTTTLNILQSTSQEKGKIKNGQREDKHQKTSEDWDRLKGVLKIELKENARKLQVPLDLRPFETSLRNCDRGNSGILGENEVRLLGQHYLPLTAKTMERMLSYFDPGKSGWIAYPRMLELLEQANPIFLPELANASSKMYRAGETSNPNGNTRLAHRRDTFVVPQEEETNDYRDAMKSQRSSRRKKWKEGDGPFEIRTPAEGEGRKSQARRKWELETPLTNVRGASELYKSAYKNVDTEEITIMVNSKEHVLYPPDELDITPVYRKTLDKKLQLKKIHGYSGTDRYSNMCCLGSGELAYVAGIFVAIWNSISKTQRHYKDHNGKITCLAVHPDGQLLASAQTEGVDEDNKAKVLIRVWSSSNLQTMAVIGDGICAQVITGLCFSVKFNADRGFFLFATDKAKEPMLTVWNWKSSQLVAKAVVPTSVLLGVVCSPVNDEVAVYGREYIARWMMDENKNFRCEKLRCMDKLIPKLVTVALYTRQGKLVAGDSSGFIHIWNKGSKKSDYIIRNAHEGSISSLHLFGDVLLSAGQRDLKVHAWNDQFEPTGVDIPVRRIYQGCRCIATNESTLFIGTTSNAVLQTNVGSESVSLSSSREILSLVSDGHGDSIVGVCCHPFEKRVITAAADGSVNSYSTPEDVLNWKVTVQGNASGLTIHPSGNVLLVSCFDGSVHVIDGNSGQFITKSKASRSGIHVLEFSPDTSLLAAGTHEGKVYIFKYDRSTHELETIGVGKGLSAPISTLDWSIDNKHVRAQSSSADIMCWQVPDMIVKPLFEMRNERWHSYHCSLDYMVAGLWTQTKFSNPETAYVIAVSNSYGLTARGDLQGNIRMYGFPAAKGKPSFICEQTSSNPVKFLRFTPDGQRVLAIASEEGIIYEWSIV